MIVEMHRVRVLGPRAAFARTIEALQDASVLHVGDARGTGGLERHVAGPTERRRRRNITAVLERIEAALANLAALGAAEPDAAPVPPEGRAARIAARVVDETARMVVRRQGLLEDREALLLYEPLFDDLDRLLGAGDRRRFSTYLLTVRSQAALAILQGSLEATLGADQELRSRVLAATGEIAALLLVSSTRADEIERLLVAARVDRAALPPALAGVALGQVLPQLRSQVVAVERELAALGDRARQLARDHGGELVAARARFHDYLLVFAAADHAAESKRVFAIEGWVPARALPSLRDELAAIPELAIEILEQREWKREDAPVVLENPRLFAPFEALISLLPLPRYGSVDPTPFVAVFFPLFFGVVVGDVGYGLAMGAIAVALAVRGGTAAKLAKIIGAVAIYAIAFGVLYGELFGDLGERLFGMHALWFDRREAVLGFLVLAVSLGVVHLVLGLVIAAANRWDQHRREALGRGVTALMLVLVVLALLAVLDWLPSGLLTPIAVALLISFPLVIILEGATALLDFMTIVGHVLSYARVMALGTASVMLAVVANQMTGAFGSVAIGIAFALLFHLVNFAITLFSPTIHVMRLHYVEFFGTFFEPGGGPYQPLRHWSPKGVMP